MNGGVDELMATCPLKHEIRVSLWRPYILKLRKRPITYLTLYSPPIMDVKLLQHLGLISVDDEKYLGVVGVGINAESEADTVSNLDRRLDLLISGEINGLINGKKTSKKVKQLDEKFPFDVINLDYTDPLHKYGLDQELSPHVEAIDNIFKKQQKGNSDQFVLFLTTFTRIEAYKDDFISHLKEIIDDNIAKTPNFKEKLLEVTGYDNQKDYFDNLTNNCFAVAITKLILKFMADYNYTLAAGDIQWLIRDAKPPERNLLHLAFHIKRYVAPKIASKKNIGNRKNNVEHKSVEFIRESYVELKETTDRERLNATHSQQITSFNNKTFEIKIPEPES